MQNIFFMYLFDFQRKITKIHIQMPIAFGDPIDSMNACMVFF